MNLALFDFDGTITNADTFTPFIYFAVHPLRVLLGSALLSPLILGYKLKLVPTSRVRAEIVRFGLRGRRHDEVQALGARYSALRIPGVLRPEMLEKIRWHQGQGDQVVVVSASLDVYLRPWCDSLGVDLICTELEIKGQGLTGRYAGGDCTGAEKARRVAARYDLSRYSTVYAYGDTEEDRALLLLAQRRFFRGQEVAF